MEGKDRKKGHAVVQSCFGNRSLGEGWQSCSRRKRNGAVGQTAHDSRRTTHDAGRELRTSEGPPWGIKGCARGDGERGSSL
jgi:hypothetical protein